MKDINRVTPPQEMVWLPVRCCCTPEKVFGFLRLKKEDTKFDVVVIDMNRLPIGYAAGMPEVVTVEIRRSNDVLRMRRYQDDDDDLAKMTTELAIYSDDRPREFWRMIPGFIEVPEKEDGR